MRTEKYCKRCDRTLPVAKFTKSANRYDGLQAYCSDCMKAYRIEHYNNNKQAYYDRAFKNKARLKQYVLDLKKQSKCKDCNESFPGEPWLLEFDHVNSNKKNTISILISMGSMSNLLDEINKCEIVCVLCHRRRTALRANWVDNYLAHLLD